jgi:hypothetical protein
MILYLVTGRSVGALCDAGIRVKHRFFDLEHLPLVYTEGGDAFGAAEVAAQTRADAAATVRPASCSAEARVQERTRVYQKSWLPSEFRRWLRAQLRAGPL